MNLGSGDIEKRVNNNGNSINNVLLKTIEEYKKDIGLALKNLSEQQNRLHSQYVQISTDYYNGIKTLSDVFSFLENNIEYEIVGTEKLGSIKDKRGVFIANHPYTSQELRLSSATIANNFKGEAKYAQLHTPLLRSFLRDKTLKDIAFKTFVDPIGYSLAQAEMNNIDLPNENKYGFIKDFLLAHNKESAFLFPEGGYKNGSEFHKGFYRIAKEINCDYIVTIAMTDYLSLFHKNKVHIIDVHQTSELIKGEEASIINQLHNEIFQYKKKHL